MKTLFCPRVYYITRPDAVFYRPSATFGLSQHE